MESIAGPSPISSGKSPSRRPTPPLRKRLALSCFTLFVTALLLEGGTRIFVSPPAPVELREGIYVSQLPMVNGRDTVNSVQGPELPEQKRAGEIRVFVFGESSVEGAPWTYPGSPPTMLHDHLRASMPGRDITVVNMGRSASMTRDAYYFLVSIARFHPDFVVFYQGMNDEFHTDREVCLPATHPTLHAAWRWLVERSRFLWTVRALAPAAYVRMTHATYQPSGAPSEGGCDADLAFRAWADLLIKTAKGMGAHVLATTTVENPLSSYEPSAPWGAPADLGLERRSDSYRKLLACVLTPGCDVPAAFAVGQEHTKGTDSQAVARGAAWIAAATSLGADVVDFHRYLDERTQGGLSPSMFAEEVHLTLDGNWRLSWLWSEALRARIEGQTPDAGLPRDPAPIDPVPYLSAITQHTSRSRACILLHCADTYLRMGMPLIAASLLESAGATTAGAPEGSGSEHARAEAALVAGWLRGKLGLDPGLPPELAVLQSSVDLSRLSDELREHDDCTMTQATVAIAHEQGSASVDQGPHLITRSQEQTMGQLLGIDGAMLGGCRLDDAQIEQTHVRATYKCADDKIAGIELNHPSSHVTILAKTAKFVISPGEPAPPAALVEDLAQRIRSKEASFTWSDPSSADVVPVTAPATRRSPLLLMAIGGGLLAALLFFLLRRATRK